MKVDDDHPPNEEAKLIRSFSLPESCNSGFSIKDEEGERVKNHGLRSIICGLSTKRKSKSLPRVDDQMNSAAARRKQPHPFAMQTFGFRSPMNGLRATRFPEWPPPDPPQMTPINFGLGRVFHGPPHPPPLIPNPVASTGPPRPWWRRVNPARSTEPIVHVTIDLTDENDTIAAQLVERPQRAGWTSESEDVEVEQDTDTMTDTNLPIVQQASWNQVEDGTRNVVIASTVVASTSRPMESSYHVTNPVRLNHHHHHQRQLQVRQPPESDESLNVHMIRDELNPQYSTVIFPAEMEMVSVNSEELQEESTFQIFFVSLDSNPTMHAAIDMTEFEDNFPTLRGTVSREAVRMTYRTNLGEFRNFIHSDMDESDDD